MPAPPRCSAARCGRAGPRGPPPGGRRSARPGTAPPRAAAAPCWTAPAGASAAHRRSGNLGEEYDEGSRMRWRGERTVGRGRRRLGAIGKFKAQQNTVRLTCNMSSSSSILHSVEGQVGQVRIEGIMWDLRTKQERNVEYLFVCKVKPDKLVRHDNQGLFKFFLTQRQKRLTCEYGISYDAGV